MTNACSFNWIIFSFTRGIGLWLIWRLGRAGDWKWSGVTGDEDVVNDDCDGDGDGDDDREAPGGHSTGLDTIAAGHRHRMLKLLITWNKIMTMYHGDTVVVSIVPPALCWSHQVTDVNNLRVHIQLSRFTTWLHWLGCNQLASHCFQDTCSTQYTTTTRVHGWLFKYFSCYGCYFL